jgi:hypothetical protein
MISVNSKNNILIRLTNERIVHIERNHPEINSCSAWILETIENPDFILAGDKIINPVDFINHLDKK